MITKENCLAQVNEAMLYNEGDVKAKSAAWWVVYTFLCENGLEEYRRVNKLKLSGIEEAITFLEFLLNKVQNAKECDATDAS